MRKLIVSVMVAALLAGCGPQYALRGTDGKPTQLVVSAYTQDGCMEKLREYATQLQVMTNLSKVESDLGWEILLFPFYKGYRCTGTVVEMKKPSEQPQAAPAP